MQISREDRVRMERAHVHAWPASDTADIDGWLWRASGGGSHRANSVSTIDFHGCSPAAAIETVEARYSARGARSQFQTFDESSPEGLPDLLRDRGYTPGGGTITMFKRLAAVSADNAEVEWRDHAWDEWQHVYLGEITENRRAVNQMILARVPAPRAFFGYRRGGEIVATALCVIGFGCAVVECVTTRADMRRQGAAQCVLVALEAWAARQAADLIGLQVVADNLPAIALYERCGFVAGARNEFWVND
jgi:GNAT superfamily N-acetyltransferase